MLIGVLRVDVTIFEAQSLKDKRQVLQGLKQRMRDRFNVSVTEVEFGDSPKRSQLGVALVSTDSRALHAQLDKIVELFRHTAGLQLVDYNREIL